MEAQITLTDIIVERIADAIEELTLNTILYIRLKIERQQHLHMIAQRTPYGSIRTGYVYTQSDTMPSQFTEHGVYGADMWKEAGITFLHGVSGVITHHTCQKVQNIALVDGERKSSIIIAW